METNPVTLAALFMSPGSIGQPGDSGGVVAVPENVKTAEDFVLYLLRQGYPPLAHIPTPPGYRVPEDAWKWITVPDAELGTGSPHASQSYHSIETDLAILTQGLVGPIITQGLTDAQVSKELTAQALKSAAWLVGHDPDAANIPALVAKYVAIYRKAVTPV